MGLRAWKGRGDHEQPWMGALEGGCPLPWTRPRRRGGEGESRFPDAVEELGLCSSNTRPVLRSSIHGCKAQS
jgi:hypothetical protein